MAKSNEKEARKQEAEKRRKRKNLLIICGVAACCVLAVVLVIVLQPKTVSVVRGANADLIVQDADIKSGLNHIDYGGPQQLLFWRNAQGVVMTAYDTCEECFATGNVRYSLSNNELTCSSCQTKVAVSTLGAHSWGGCQPVAIPIDFRNDTDTEIVIPSDVLDHAEEVFAQWTLGNYESSLSAYAHEHADEDDHEHEDDEDTHDH